MTLYCADIYSHIFNNIPNKKQMSKINYYLRGLRRLPMGENIFRYTFSCQKY